MNRDKTFLAKRRDRMIAIILSFKEQECDRFLPQEVSAELREVILYEINQFCDTVFDLILDDGVIWNEEFMNRFEELLDKMEQIG